MTASRVVVVEDSEPIRLAVAAALRAQGLQVTAVRDGRGLEQLLADGCDLVVLDVMLPGRDGLELLEVVRTHSTAGVLLLTARDTTADRVEGLSRGADDYVVKPFAMAELLARCTAVLRRLGVHGAVVAVGDLDISDDCATVVRAGVRIELTETERRILAYLASRRDRPVSKTQLLTAVWGYTGFDPNVVEVHVSALRRKLELHGPRLIHTVRGAGYRLGDVE